MTSWKNFKITIKSSGRFFSFFLSLVLLPLVVTIIVKLFGDRMNVWNERLAKAPMIGVIVLVSIFSLIIFYIIAFLKGDINKLNEKRDGLRLNSETEKEINKRINEYFSNNSTVSALEENIYRKTTENFEESIFTKLKYSYSAEGKQLYITNIILDSFLPLENDTRKYIDKIERNSIVNLIIGIVGTVSSITILAVSLTVTNEFANFTDFGLHFLPRITFVILIQLFSFFFLKLYKSNLEDLKYFQNELTNINAKIAVIKISAATGEFSKLEPLLNQMIAIERNFKLQKDESLPTLERMKIEKDVQIELINTLKEFAKSNTQ